MDYIIISKFEYETPLAHINENIIMKDAYGSLGLLFVCGTVLLDLWLELSMYIFIPLISIGLYLSSYHLYNLYLIWKNNKNN